jgi:hypothetical protein
MFLLNLNILRPFWFTTRFLSLILMLSLPKSFLALKMLILQFSKYYTLLRFSVYVSLLVSVAQISILLPKPNSLASSLAVLITSKNTNIYILTLKSSIDSVIYVSVLILNSVLSCLINDRFFLFKCTQK